MGASRVRFISESPGYDGWKYILVLHLYCCDIPEGKDILCILHGLNNLFMYEMHGDIFGCGTAKV